MNRLFEHELASDCGVHHLVGIADPRRARREPHFPLRTVALVIDVGLRAVMQTEHQVIVLAAPAFRHAKRREYCAFTAPHAPDARQEMFSHCLEALADPPYAIFAAWIDIAEHAQDPLAAIGARRKSVDVQTGIVLAP